MCEDSVGFETCCCALSARRTYSNTRCGIMLRQNRVRHYFHSLTLMSREAEMSIFPEVPEIVAKARTASRCESWRSCAADACVCGFAGTGVSCCSTMPLNDFSENFGRGPEILPDITRDFAASPGCHTRIHASVLPETIAPLGSVKSARTPGGLDTVDNNSSARRSSLNVP